MKAQKDSGDDDAPTSTDFVQDSSVNGWLSVIALQKVSGDTKATTAAQILTALSAAKNVDLGIIPPWTPTKPVSSSYPRVSSPFMYLTKFEGSKLVLVDKQPVHTTSLLTAPDRTAHGFHGVRVSPPESPVQDGSFGSGTSR